MTCSQTLLRPNYALERSVRGLAKGAAGAWEMLAPAAPSTGCTAARSTRTLGVTTSLSDVDKGDLLMKSLVTAVLAFALTSIVMAQEQSTAGTQRSNIEQVIRQLDGERIQAQIGADAAALDRIYADDFIGVGPSGTVRTKKQVILDFTSGTLKFQSVTTNEVQVRVYENTAVETGLSTMDGQDNGKAVPVIPDLLGYG